MSCQRLCLKKESAEWWRKILHKLPTTSHSCYHDYHHDGLYLPFLLPQLPPWWPIPSIPVTTNPTMTICTSRSCYHDSYHDSLYLLFLLPWLPIITICAFCSCYHDSTPWWSVPLSHYCYHDSPPWWSIPSILVTMFFTMTVCTSCFYYHDSHHNSLYLPYLLPWLHTRTICTSCSCCHDFHHKVTVYTMSWNKLFLLQVAFVSYFVPATHKILVKALPPKDCIEISRCRNL